MKIQASFDAQAWLNDYAISVDPQGNTDWDVTEYFETLPSDVRRRLLDKARKNNDFVEQELDLDLMTRDPSAPEWVRHWNGPFEITLRIEGASMTTYKIMRFYQRDDFPPELIIGGLTLEQAQAHCGRPESGSRTATDEYARERTYRRGQWFDGYTAEEGES